MRGVDARDASHTRPAAPAPAGGTDGGEGYGWLLINRLADAVEVRPVPESGKTVRVHLTAGS
ncbi:hypothetical protein OHB39_37310 [Streptomyces sp. NBC_00047]|uniref:hypothetical protein n=1 Tax=Streptomyces sp. NBC_00047 TaxID=2975627 RepID=UPI002253D6EC|nr:hypothetical protein [Streptomyces sp. NBC_00047]MCX5613150.1 hypothetical protein [Streptomyces sp. NBC_00047]